MTTTTLRIGDTLRPGQSRTVRIASMVEITFQHPEPQPPQPPPPPPPPPPAPAAGVQQQPAPEPNAMLEFGALLSPSQVETWIDCQAKWYFRYFRQLPDKPTGSLAFGSAIHETLSRNFEVKAHVGRDLKITDAIELFTSAWRAHAADAVFRHNQNPDAYEIQGQRLVAKYIAEVAPEIHPAVIANQPAVEMEVTGTIGGVPARGFIDLIDTEGRVVDLKSSSRSSKEMKPSHRAQLSVYKVIGPKMLSGDCRVDLLVRKSEPEIIPLDHRVTDQDERFVERLYPIAQAGMREGLYIPNRSSTYCTRLQCPYWRECMEEFGGDVPV